MARRAKDTGDPGKYYFHKPICLNIALPTDEESQPCDKPERKPSPVNLVNYRDRTNCRLYSIKNGHNYDPPEKINYLLEQHPNGEEIGDYLKLKSLEGFGEGAIVTRRWHTSNGHRWAQMWGTIILVHKTPRGGIANWTPYAVKWHQLGEVEQAWAEDLLVIHAALDNDQLDSIVEAQQ